MMSKIEAKKCYTCKVNKPSEDYYLDRKSKDGLQGKCKRCQAVYNQSSTRKAVKKRYDTKEGWCTYIAKFSSDRIYIGSGQKVNRESDHMNGNSRIAKSLREVAIAVDIVYTGEGEDCLVEEDRLIREIGLDNLLNTRHAIKNTGNRDD